MRLLFILTVFSSLTLAWLVGRSQSFRPCLSTAFVYELRIQQTSNDETISACKWIDFFLKKELSSQSQFILNQVNKVQSTAKPIRLVVTFVELNKFQNQKKLWILGAETMRRGGLEEVARYQQAEERFKGLDDKLIKGIFENLLTHLEKHQVTDEFHLLDFLMTAKAYCQSGNHSFYEQHFCEHLNTYSGTLSSGFTQDFTLFPFKKLLTFWLHEAYRELSLRDKVIARKNLNAGHVKPVLIDWSQLWQAKNYQDLTQVVQYQYQQLLHALGWDKKLEKGKFLALVRRRLQLADVKQVIWLKNSGDFLLHQENGLKQTLVLNADQQLVSRSSGEVLRIKVEKIPVQASTVFLGARWSLTEIAERAGGRRAYALSPQDPVAILDLEARGVDSYLRTHTDVAFLTLHPPSLRLALQRAGFSQPIFPFKKNQKPHMMRLFGWEKVETVEGFTRFRPLAQVAGVLSFRF